jgi:hypothetical protein
MRSHCRAKHGFRWGAFCVVAVLVCGTGGSVWAQGGELSTERKVQAGFLLNFARYVEWPNAVFASGGAPVCIGVLGDDPYGAFLDDTVRGETIRGHGIVVRRERTADALRDCHVVYIGPADPEKLTQILASFSGKPILTVGNDTGFVARGGIVNFFLENERVRFEISRAASERSGLKMHPQLLRLARVVNAGLSLPKLLLALVR